MAKQDIIATWIYLDSADESSEYPQVGKASHQWDFQKVYWRCVAVFYELSLRTNPDKRHILFSNAREADLPDIDGYNLRARLQEMGVEVVTLPLTFQTPKGYHGKWRNQFYIFDILKFFEANSANDAACVVFDSDCLITQSLDDLFADIRQFGLLVLPMDYEDNHNVNGLTRLDMQRLYSELSGIQWPEVPIYWGGEIFAGTMDTIRQINALVPQLWQEMLRRHAAGQLKFNEEAHLLSYCYEQIDTVYAWADAYIKRLWTAPHYNNVVPTDASLPVWHLPSEKTGGIALLFDHLRKQKQIWKSPVDVKALGGYVGIPKRTKYLSLKQWLRYHLRFLSK